MKLLFVNACPRGAASRTLRLAETFLDAFVQEKPDTTIIRHDLPKMGLRPVDAATLARKEALCDERKWSDPLFAPVLDFQSADAVVIAAPYWDLSFPAILKIWVENMYVRNLTFYYDNDRPVGLCRGCEAVYITTAGSPIGANDWGAGYMQAVLTTLGIPRFTAIRAEALDLDSTDAEAVLAEAEMAAKTAAKQLAARLHT